MSNDPSVKIENIIWIVILALWFVVQMVLGRRAKKGQPPSQKGAEAQEVEPAELPLDEQIKRMLSEFAGIPAEDMPPIKKLTPPAEKAASTKKIAPRSVPVRPATEELVPAFVGEMGKEGEVLRGSMLSKTLREVPSHAGRGLLMNTFGIRMPTVAHYSLIRSPGMANNALRPKLTDRQQLREAIIHQNVLSRPLGW